MSQENVDRFVRVIEAFNRIMDIPGVLRFMDPEVQFEHRLAELEGSYAGFEAVNGFFADVVEHFDALLALGTTRLTGKGSSVETELPFAVVARFRDGRMTHFTDYGDIVQALEAVGLEE